MVYEILGSQRGMADRTMRLYRVIYYRRCAQGGSVVSLSKAVNLWCPSSTEVPLAMKMNNVLSRACLIEFPINFIVTQRDDASPTSVAGDGFQTYRGGNGEGKNHDGVGRCPC